jgi:hypothetical protein
VVYVAISEHGVVLDIPLAERSVAYSQIARLNIMAEYGGG